MGETLKLKKLKRMSKYLYPEFIKYQVKWNIFAYQESHLLGDSLNLRYSLSEQTF